nr:growth/differentiation factor 15 [Anolis sagrei ordinatus]
MEPDASEGQPGQLYSLEVSRTATLRRDLHVLRAELTLFGNVTGAHVYKLDEGKLSRNHIPTVSVSPSTLTLDLRDFVSAWLAGPEPSLHLVLAFSIPVEFEQMMEVETRERQRPVRKVRQAQQVDTEDEECSKGEGKCCLRSLKVSFEAIGWSDWVVAPRSYSMKFCQGSCPHNYKPASIHAQIKARLHSLSGEAPAPCCVPAGYEPMVLMHYGDDGKVVAQVFEDMIVTRCHCA